MFWTESFAVDEYPVNVIDEDLHPSHEYNCYKGIAVTHLCVLPQHAADSRPWSRNNQRSPQGHVHQECWQSKRAWVDQGLTGKHAFAGKLSVRRCYFLVTYQDRSDVAVQRKLRHV